LQRNEVPDIKKSKKFGSPRKTNRTDPMTFIKLIPNFVFDKLLKPKLMLQ